MGNKWKDFERSTVAVGFNKAPFHARSSSSAIPENLGEVARSACSDALTNQVIKPNDNYAANIEKGLLKGKDPATGKEVSKDEIDGALDKLKEYITTAKKLASMDSQQFLIWSKAQGTPVSETASKEEKAPQHRPVLGG